MAPKNGWLEYDRFLLGPGLFSGANLLLVLGSVYWSVFIPRFSPLEGESKLSTCCFLGSPPFSSTQNLRNLRETGSRLFPTDTFQPDPGFGGGSLTKMVLIVATLNTEKCEKLFLLFRLIALEKAACLNSKPYPFVSQNFDSFPTQTSVKFMGANKWYLDYLSECHLEFE